MATVLALLAALVAGLKVATGFLSPLLSLVESNGYWMAPVAIAAVGVLKITQGDWLDGVAWIAAGYGFYEANRNLKILGG